MYHPLTTHAHVIHNIATWQTDKLHVNLCNLEITSKLIWHSGVLLWNNSPDVRQQVTLNLHLNSS